MVRQVVIIRVFFAILRAALRADSPGTAACRAAAAVFRHSMAVVAVTGAGVRAVVIQYPGAIVVFQRADFFFSGELAVLTDKIFIPSSFRAGRSLGFVRFHIMGAGESAVFCITHFAHGLFDAGRRTADMPPDLAARYPGATISTICNLFMICLINFLPPLVCNICPFSTRITHSGICQRNAAGSD